MLVNNAGTYIDKPFLEMDYERYRRTIDLNVTAGYFLTQSFARKWVAAEHRRPRCLHRVDQRILGRTGSHRLRHQ